MRDAMSSVARLGRVVAVAGLIGTVVAATLGMFVAGQAVRSGDAVHAASIVRGSPALGATSAYTSPTATVTPTTGITLTATPAPTDTPTATHTSTATATATNTSTPSPTATVTPRPTLPPRPVHLPVTLRDPACVPATRHSDIVFVVDVSSYMRNPFDGKLSAEWVREWMRWTVDRVDMSKSRLGIVHFNRDVGIAQHLTNDRQAVLTGIDAQPPRNNSTTRMDAALRVARDMLLGEQATPGNAKVIFFMSIMQAKNVPWEHIPGCVEKRGDECAVLAAANEVKGGPGNITIYALATSWYGGGEDLKGVASDPGKAYLLPGPAEFDRIVSETRVTLPCPPDLFWPHARP